MKKFWSLNSEARALIVSTLLIVIGVGGTAFLFWFHRYDIPLAILLGGGIVALAWFALYLAKKASKPHIKTEIAIMFSRLIVITLLAILFAVLAYHASIVIISPIFMIIAYFVISVVAMVFYIRKGE